MQLLLRVLRRRSQWKEETTTFTLIPIVKEQISIPLIAAGGIASGKECYCHGSCADGVQIGSRFAASYESSAHDNFKNKILETKEGIPINIKELTPVRLIKNKFYQDVENLYAKCAKVEDLRELLWEEVEPKGMFEGDLDEGELEIGQVAGLIHEIKFVDEIMTEIIQDFESIKRIM